MKLFQKILIPTDLSAVADSAVHYAIALCRNTNAQLLFFHAGKNSTEQLREHIAKLDVSSDLKSHEIKYIASDLVFNVDKIKTLVREHDISMVVMGTHGENTPLPSKIFGRNTTALIEDVGIPVIAVPANYVYKGISRIAYAADLIKLKEELEEVVTFAKHLNASVDVFHVTPVFPDIFDTEKKDVDPIIEQVKEASDFQFIKYHVEETERDNQIKKGIDNYMEEHPVDLLVLFHITRGWIDKIITPSSAIKQIAQIKVPILVFPKKV
jgi:nucleotide-binding universal stress UspA family protein